MVLKGIVVFKSLSSNPDYVLLNESGYESVRQVGCKTNFEIGTLVEADSENAGEIKAISDKGLEKEIGRSLEKKSASYKTALLVDDEAMRKFQPRMQQTAEFVARRLLLLHPVLIRFNDDCDGISAGMLVKKAVEEFVKQNEIPFPKGFLKNKQCNSAVYDSGEAAWDADQHSFAEYGKKPLLFLLDFGGNEESVEGLEAADSVFDVVILDHHVFSQNAKGKAAGFLNPLEYGGTSWHTTGLVAYEFARTLVGKKAEEWEEYAFYSLESDKSIFRKKEIFKQALVLDYLATEGLSLEKYEKALEEDLQLHYLEATGKISAAKEKALKKTRILEIGKAKLILADLEGTTSKNEFPPKGKVLNEVQKHYGGEEEGGMVASIGFDSTAIQFRVSRALHSKGFKATRIIDLIKKEFGGEGISGGGHEQAAAMRFGKENSKAVLDKTVEISKKEIENAL